MIRRFLLKLLLWVVLLIGVFYPRLDLAWRQLFHFADWERLIDPNLAAMPDILAEIDAMLPPDCPPSVEVKKVQEWVNKRIPYRRDWFTWSNVDYWPTAAEVLEAGREDCDGRAVLAVSILQARGFTTARLAANWAHVWAVVEPNDPKMKSAEPVGLMKPLGAETFRRGKSGVSFHAPDWTIIRLTLLELSLLPAWRFLLLVGGTLALLFHPCRNWRMFLLPLGFALIAHLSFLDWAARTHNASGEAGITPLIISSTCLALALALAATARWWSPQPLRDDPLLDLGS